MKHILLISLLILGFWSCQDDDSSFGVTIPQENLSFRPIAGGAIMHYKLPQDKDILSIRVRYQDALGQNVLCSGSYACDSLLLLGFNEAQQDVRAFVSLCSRDDVESDPMEVSFDTKDSGPVAFFEQLEVKPSWNGFMLTFDVPEQANGMAHVFYIGENPLTHEPDTLLMSSFVITAGADTLTFSLKQSGPTNDVVVRTEDFRGYMVKQKIWEKVEAYNTGKLDFSEFDFEDPEKLSLEDPDYCLGHKYLFDGDVTGESCYRADKKTLNTYAAGPGCPGRTMCILDMREKKMVAAVRLYTMMQVNRSWPTSSDKYYRVFRSGYYLSDMLPCNITIFASNDKATWKKVGSFEQFREIGGDARWYKNAFNIDNYNKSQQEIKDSDPYYVEISFPATGESYRYLKININELYKYEYDYMSSSYANNDQYMTLHELEIYTNKD